MKKLFNYALCLCLAFLCLTSCTSEDEMASPKVTKDAYTFGKGSHVSFQNVQTLVAAQRPATRAAESEEYQFITDYEIGDTLFYVVNYPEGGWTMYASDKRVPAVVAENESGKFVLEEIEDCMGEWFEAMKEDMKVVRLIDNERLNFTEEEIEANCNYWNAVCNIDEFIKSQRTETRAVGGLSFGHYELYATYNDVVIYDSIDHLTVTKWIQGEPYNYYCPRKSTGFGNAPAGCVAIAGAQMLYYLYQHLGIPQTIPDQAYCNSTVNPSHQYDWDQWSTGADVWGQIEDSPNSFSSGLCVAPFIAHIGKRINMKYGDEGSSIPLSNIDLLISNVFNYYGISCQHADFDANSIRTSLLGNMPAIALAYGIKEGHVYDAGHVFIIDRYKRSRTKTSYYYAWVSDQIGFPLKPTITYPDSVRIEYSTPYITQIGMNWGWREFIDYNNHWRYINMNDAWYAPTGSWVVENNNTTYTYDYARKMIYNFSAMQ